MTARHILLVTGADDVARAVDAALHFDGVELLRVRSCDEANDLFDESCEMVVVDLAALDDKAGALPATLRDQDFSAVVPILFLGSGDESIHDLGSAIEAGGDGFLRRPLKAAVLSAKVQGYLGAAPVEKPSDAHMIPGPLGHNGPASPHIDLHDIEGAIDDALQGRLDELPQRARDRDRKPTQVASPEDMPTFDEIEADENTADLIKRLRKLKQVSSMAKNVDREDEVDAWVDELVAHDQQEPTAPSPQGEKEAPEAEPESSSSLGGQEKTTPPATDAQEHEDHAANALEAETQKLEDEARQRAAVEAQRIEDQARQRARDAALKLEEQARQEAEARAREAAIQAEQEARKRAQEVAASVEHKARERAEALAQRLQEEAQKKAEEEARSLEKKASVEAERRAKELLEKARSEAQRRAKKIKRQAEERAAAEADRIREQAQHELEQEAQRLRAEALEQARHKAEALVKRAHEQAQKEAAELEQALTAEAEQRAQQLKVEAQARAEEKRRLLEQQIHAEAEAEEQRIAEKAQRVAESVEQRVAETRERERKLCEIEAATRQREEALRELEEQTRQREQELTAMEAEAQRRAEEAEQRRQQGAQRLQQGVFGKKTRSEKAQQWLAKLRSEHTEVEGEPDGDSQAESRSQDFDAGADTLPPTELGASEATPPNRVSAMPASEATTAPMRPRSANPFSVASLHSDPDASRPAALVGDGPCSPLAPEQGLFDEGQLVAVLAEISHQQVTGRVDFVVEGSNAQRSLFFEQGLPVLAQSSLSRDRFEAYLHRKGLLTREQHALARAMQINSARPLGVALLEDGLLKTRELFDAVRDHLAEVVIALLEWPRGAFRYSAEKAPLAERVAPAQTALELLAEGVRRKYDVPRLLRAIGGPSTLLAPTDPVRLNDLGLRPDEQLAAELVDGVRTLEDLILSAGIDEQVAYRVALLGVAVGAFTVAARGVDPMDTDQELAEQHERAIDRVRLQERLRQAREQDYFTFLGLDREATAYEVEQAVAQILDELDQLRLVGEGQADIQAGIAEVWQVAQDALATLANDRSRERYRRHLRQPPN